MKCILPSFLPLLGLACLASFGADSAADPIDRQALVQRHSPLFTALDYDAPLTVGNGGFAFTVGISGLQNFGEAYYEKGIPLETLTRWCWVEDENTEGYTLEDASRSYRQADGSSIRLPTEMDSPAGHWLRINPRLHPLGRLSLQWDKPDGTAFTENDIREPVQSLDLWQGVVTTRYILDGLPVTVILASDPGSDAIAVRIQSEWVARGALRVALHFPRGHDTSEKNTPALVWDLPESHQSELIEDTLIARDILSTRYYLRSDLPFRQEDAPHQFSLEAMEGDVMEFSLRFSEDPVASVRAPAAIRTASARHWEAFWQSGAAVDFSGSTHPLASKLEERAVLSQYLTAVQGVADVPAQESGLTCNTWYGKHHTEMIWWHNAHFILWGRPQLAEKNLAWFIRQLPVARERATSRGLEGARWAKMVGPEGRESPGGNPLIVWNQPHPIYLAELLWRQSPGPETLEKYRDLVLESAACMASMVWFDPDRGEYLLGPPLWIAQEIHDPAESQNPSLELAYWRWGLETAQRWRERLGLEREAHWDHIVAHLPPIPQADGKYVALESHPDTWTDFSSRHDHPQMLMPLGFLPDSPYVDRDIMDRTLTAVLEEWDWETKIWGWDYPMAAMTAVRLGRPEEALEILLRDGPNNTYTPNGHCPQGSDRAEGQLEGRREIAVYLPANGSFLATLALMVAGWDGSAPYPGFPEDGQWSIRAEGFAPLP